MAQRFHEDCINLARSALHEGKVDRRTFISSMAATGLLATTAGRALAQENKEVVFCGWGGLANEAYQKIYCEPYMEANPSVKIVQDTSGAYPGRIRSMVDTNTVAWDLGDSDAPSAYVMGKQGLLEEIDYSVVNKADAADEIFTQEYGATPFAFSSIMVYNSEKYGDAPPKTWAEFYDFDMFPGTRMMQKDAQVQLETLQLALRNDTAALYPIDVSACLEKLKEIKDKVLFWDSGAQSEELMRSGEADLGIMWAARGYAVSRDTNGRLKTTWNQGILQPGSFIIPKGAPQAAEAQKLLASMLARPEGQIEALRILGVAPTNPKAEALVPEDLRERNPMSKENRAVQVLLNAEWWGENYATVNQAYLDVISA